MSSPTTENQEAQTKPQDLKDETEINEQSEQLKQKSKDIKHETDDDEESESDDGQDSVYQPSYYRKKTRNRTSSSGKARTRPRKNTGGEKKKGTSKDLNNPITKTKILQQQILKQKDSQKEIQKRLFTFEDKDVTLECLVCDYRVSRSKVNSASGASSINEFSQISTQTSQPTNSAPSTNSISASSNFQNLFSELKDFEAQKDDILKHLLTEHSIVIADVDAIALFSRYLSYWKEHLKNKPLQDVACEIHAQQSGASVSDENKQFWMISSLLPEDKDIRDKLGQERLNRVIGQQQDERENDHFRKQCLFCSTTIQGTRQEILQHMFSVHYFNIGLADNMIYFTHFIDLLHNKIDSLQCIYCERTFKSISVLREHIRKKKHFKLNPDNTEYDCFYIANYLETGKGWQELAAEVDEGEESAGSQSAYSSFSESEPDIGLVDDTEEFFDWDEEVPEDCKCLFCSLVFPKANAAFIHMNEIHGFDFYSFQKKWKLNFYDCIKLINYIRSKVTINQCPLCLLSHPTGFELLQHLDREKHYSVDRGASWWQDDSFLQPIMENDNLLCSLGEGAEGDDDSDEDSDSEFEQRRLFHLAHEFGHRYSEDDDGDDEYEEDEGNGKTAPKKIRKKQQQSSQTTPVSRSLP